VLAKRPDSDVPHGWTAGLRRAARPRHPVSRTKGPWLEPVLAAGRRLERSEPGAGRIEWRFAEILSADILRTSSQNPDGAEVYSEFIDSDGRSYGTTFQPENATPVRRRLMTVGGGDTVGDALSWYSARIRMILMIDAPDGDVFDDQVHMFRAADFDAAFARAIEIGRAQESDFINGFEERAQRRLVEVQSLNLLGSGALGDTNDVYREPVPMRDADRVPFDTVFHPETSEPRATGV